VRKNGGPSTLFWNGVWLLLGALLLWGCQERIEDPELWTLEEVHQEISLEDGHESVSCASCHVEDRYEGTPSDCWSCHESDSGEVDDPKHSGFPTECVICHTMAGWKPSTFDHSTTDFALEGGHLSVSCASCHVEGRYGGTPSDCWSCHETDYGEAPDHVSAGFPTECVVCHTVEGWKPATFDHSTTGFILEGGHVSVSCLSCHVEGQYGGTPSDCWSCHETDYVEAPDHESAGFPTECMVCHTVAGWKPSTFDHSTTDFPLEGGHVSVSCSSCHVEGQYAGTPSDCWSCHESDYQGVETPDHTGFSQICVECHAVEDRKPSTFDHSTTGFALEGGHVSVSCASCHVDGRYKGTPSDCWSCHETDYAKVDDPDHSGFPTECLQCHTITGWKPATFDHSVTNFPLEGSHVSVSCASCHVEGRYAGTPTDCWSCHTADEPQNHFGPDCASCHTSIAWEPSTFDHEPLFPLRRGDHSRYRNDCTSCHLDPSAYSLFTCTDCHDGEHSRSKMDREHDDVRNYRYDSIACLDCHPGGREADDDDD